MTQIQEHAYSWAKPLTMRDKSDVKYEIVHHSDGALTETVDEIHAQHLAQGWAGIGYHLVIYPDGSVHQGRPFDAVPAAAQDMNTDSIDICLIGDFDPGTDGFSGFPTQAQLDALVDVSVQVHKAYPAISATIGHRDVSAIVQDTSVATACPGHNLYTWLPQLREKVAALVRS